MFLLVIFTLLSFSFLQGECIKCYDYHNYETPHGTIKAKRKKCLATRDLLFGEKICPGCKHSAQDHTVHEDQAVYNEVIEGKIVANPTKSPVLHLGSTKVKKGDTLEDTAFHVAKKIKIAAS